MHGKSEVHAFQKLWKEWAISDT